MNMTNNRRAEGIAYLNMCFEQGISWRSAKHYASERFGCKADAIRQWKKLSKYNEII